MASPIPNATTGMLIDGNMACEAIDSSGEEFDVEGADISSFDEGTGVANYEHKTAEEGGNGMEVVGKIVFAKKIFKEGDCDDERQKMYWEKVKLPFIYGIVRLYDGAGHPGAMALAAMIRDHVANKEPILVRFSIEGSTLEREGNRLKHTVCRRVALTLKPCNRTCDSGLIADVNAPEGFSKKPAEKVKDILEGIGKGEKHPMYARLGAGREDEVASLDQDQMFRTLLKAKIKDFILSKGDAAPSTLTGNAALTREDLKRKLVEVCKSYDESKHGPDIKAFVKNQLPDVSDEFIDHFSNLVNDYRVKLKKAITNQPPEERIAHFRNATNRSVEDTVADVWDEKEPDVAFPPEDPKVGTAQPKKGIPAPQTRGYFSPAAPPKKEKPKKGEKKADAEPAAPAPKKEKAPKAKRIDEETGEEIPDVPMVRGQVLKPSAFTRGLEFHEHSGVLHIPEGELRLWNPDADESYGLTSSGDTVAGQKFREIWNSPHVRKQHDYAVGQWLRLHQALKDGKLPEAVVATSTAFSQLSPNTPVPVHELMYAYLVDSMRRQGRDLRDPNFGKDFEKLYEQYTDKRKGGKVVKRGDKKAVWKDPDYAAWMAGDKPQNWPEHAGDYFRQEIPDLVTIANDSVNNSRVAGDRASFMLPVNKFRNMANYSNFHDSLVDLVARHGVDARSGVAELMDGKRLHGLHEAKRERHIKAGKPDPGPLTTGFAVPGLAPKTGRFTYAMLGGGNSFVPDTHFVRHIFGLDKATDGATIDALKRRVMWNETHSDVLSAMDRWYFRNHPAVKLMLNHPEYGSYFRANPEQAIFPAFWGHWLSIAEHERALGHKNANVSYNQSASHRPIFEEATRLLNDPVEQAKVVKVKPQTTLPGMPAPVTIKKSESAPEHGALINPVHAAYLLHDWTQQLGETHALMRFYTHLLPLLWPEHDEDEMQHVPHVDKGSILTKAEALIIELRKAADGVANELASIPVKKKAQMPVVEFGGKKVQPGIGTYKGKPIAVLHVEPNHDGHVYAVPREHVGNFTDKHIIKLPRAFEGAGYVVQKHPVEQGVSPHIIDANVHGVGFADSQEQKDLIHGLDTSKAIDKPGHVLKGVTDTVWMKNAQGKNVIVKRGTWKNMNEAHRELAYFNAAKNVFGLGDFVPTTSAFKSPTDGQMYSVQEMVPNPEHVHVEKLGFKPSEDPSRFAALGPNFLRAGAEHAYHLGEGHKEALGMLHATGDLDKLWLMNAILGNGDRHHGNYVFSKTAKKPVQLIDHSHSLLGGWDEFTVPAYQHHHHGDRQAARDAPLHPEAAKWLMSLKPEVLQSELERNEVPRESVENAVYSLVEIQRRAKNANRTKEDLLTYPHEPMLRGVPPPPPPPKAPPTPSRQFDSSGNSILPGMSPSMSASTEVPAHKKKRA